jgi:Universal stress protein family
MYPDGGHIDRAPFEREARTIVDDAVASLSGFTAVPADVSAVLAEDDAATALLHVAEDAALLVVGSRGRGGFTGLLGSVSQRCVDHAPCPVAVITPTWDGTTHRRVVVGVDGSAMRPPRAVPGRRGTRAAAARLVSETRTEGVERPSRHLMA